MIETSIITKMRFESFADFERFLVSRDCQRIHGFAAELKQALETKKAVQFITPRPEIGAVTMSEITAVEI